MRPRRALLTLAMHRHELSPTYRDRFLFEGDQQRHQADAHAGHDADTLTQAAAIADDVLGDAAARRVRVAAIEHGSSVGR